MAASVFDSPMYTQLFPTGAVGRLFSDSAAIRAMLLVEGALAKAQAQAGLIPDVSAAAIQRASHEVQIDPVALASSTGQNGISVPGLVKAFRSEMNAPEHAQYLHWGATSQDILDTALMLRLRQALVLAEEDLRALLGVLAGQAETHAETPMAARTYGQLATPTSWGAVLAQWGAPLLDALEQLPALRENNLLVSLSGASGTAAALGDQAPSIRATLAEALGLTDPGRSWHTDRTPVLRITSWMGHVTTPLGAMSETLIALSADGLNEVSFESSGESSTMPQKQNPIAASALTAVVRHGNALRSGLAPAGLHQHQRDGAAWLAEQMLVPQVVLSTASALHQGLALARSLRPNTARMRANLEAGHGAVYAEALSFALSAHMPRPRAQDVVKRLCQEALQTGTPLAELVRGAHPEIDQSLFSPEAQLGCAPADAHRFAERIKAL